MAPLMIDWEHVRHFEPREFTSPEKMQPRVIYRLDRARERAGVPIYVTSSYRDDPDSSHGTGYGVDIADNMDGEDCASRWRYHVVEALLRSGFTRIGVYDRHLHADCDPERPEQVLWWGESQ